MAKITAKEFLSDPKYSEQKGLFKEIFSGLAEEMREENKKGKRKSSDETTNIFDEIFGSKDEQ